MNIVLICAGDHGLETLNYLNDIQHAQKNIFKKIYIIDMKNIGYTASGTIPIVLNKNLNTIKSKEYALLVGFGVGLSWGLCLIKKC